MNTQIENDTFRVWVGDWNVVKFHVRKRIGIDGKKQMRNLAVLITTYDIDPKLGKSIENSHYAKHAIELLNYMGIDEVKSGFVDLLQKQGWAFEIPQYSGQGGLFS